MRHKFGDPMARSKEQTKQYTLLLGTIITVFTIGFFVQALEKQPIATVVMAGALTIAALLFFMMSQGIKNTTSVVQTSDLENQSTRPKKQITLRLDAALFDQLEHLAEEDLRSLNNQIEFMLKKSIEQQT